MLARGPNAEKAGAKFRAFFLSPAGNFILSSVSVWVFSWNLGVWKRRGRQICTFGVGCCVKPPRPPSRRGFGRHFNHTKQCRMCTFGHACRSRWASRDNQRAHTCTFGATGLHKHHNIPLDQRTNFAAGEGSGPGEGWPGRVVRVGLVKVGLTHKSKRASVMRSFPAVIKVFLGVSADCLLLKWSPLSHITVALHRILLG